MKKFLLRITALVCALCCVFGLAACGGNGETSGDNKPDSGISDGGTSDDNTPDSGDNTPDDGDNTPDDGAKDEKMSEADWMACVTAFGEETNFTLTGINVKRNSVNNISKNDGSKHHYEGFYRVDSEEKSEESYYEENGGKYYFYSIKYYEGSPIENPLWEREEMTAEAYTEEIDSEFYFERDLLAATLKEYYDEFTYVSGGKYTLAAAVVPVEEYELSDIEITVENGKFTKITLIAEYLGKLVFENIGTTVIDFVVPEVN